MREALLAQIAALRNQALLLVQQAEALETTVDAFLPGQVPEEDADGNCLHPANARERAATSGKPNQFACRRCGQYVNNK